MNKLDLIIGFIETLQMRDPSVSDLLDRDEALASARELRDMQPVAWAVLRSDGRAKLLSHKQGVEVDLKWTPLVALGESNE